ncbi:MAG TPA: carboxypeptidase-like regulatory domain-containing protein, partial [Pirellulales bacterium]|nr:carboxypeptidase-like regulatory domain-containing protein [Pirellulales bacterium]
ALPGPVHVQIIALPEGSVQLGAPWAEPFQVPSDVEEFALPTIEVAGTHKLSGRLVGAQDEPLPDVQVMAVDGGRRYGFAKTDAEGRFTMNVPDGIETAIEVYSDGRGQEPVTVIKQDPLVVRYDVGSQTQAMEAERAKKADVGLTGRVLVGGKPLAGVRLTLSRILPTTRRYQKVTSVETGADGGYSLTGLKAGDSYQIEVRPPFPAADPAWQHQLPYLPKLPDNAQGEVALPDLKLRKLTQALAGKVVDPDGKPVAGATVSAQLRDGFTSIPRLTRSGPPPWTETDHEGRFRLQQLPDEPLALMAYIHPKEGGEIRFPAKLNVELNQQDIRIVLDPSLAEEEE